MKVDVEELSPVESKVTVEVPTERVDDEIEIAYADVNKRARVPGFRPGKVPRKRLEKMFGDYVAETVSTKLIQETAQTALERKQLVPVAEPGIEPGKLEPKQPFTYTMRIEIRPKVEIKDYTGVETFREEFKITDSLLEKALSELRERHAVFKDPDPPRPAAKGDYLLLDFEATHEGNAVPSEKRENMRYPLGEETYIPELGSHLAGMNTGDTKTFKVSFPEDHNRKELAGKDIEYKVHLKEIKEKILPELDDDLAKEAGEFENLEELKTKTRENLEKYYENLAKARFERRIMDIILEKNPFSVPPSMVNRRARELTAETLRSMGVRNIGPQEFEALSENFRERAERDIRVGFLLEAVAKQENMDAGEDEIQKRIEEMAQEQNIHPDKLRDRLADDNSREMLKAYMLEQKALDFLANKAKIENRKVDPEKLDELKE